MREMKWQCRHSELYKEEPSLSLSQYHPSYFRGFLEFPDFLLSQDTAHCCHVQHCILLEANVSESKLFVFVC